MSLYGGAENTLHSFFFPSVFTTNELVQPWSESSLWLLDSQVGAASCPFHVDDRRILPVVCGCRFKARAHARDWPRVTLLSPVDGPSCVCGAYDVVCPRHWPGKILRWKSCACIQNGLREALTHSSVLHSGRFDLFCMRNCLWSSTDPCPIPSLDACIWSSIHSHREICCQIQRNLELKCVKKSFNFHREYLLLLLLLVIFFIKKT